MKQKVSIINNKPKSYVVEKVLKKRIRRGRIEYLLKWEGFPK